MASAVITDVSVFPDGTGVSVYLADDQVASGAPLGDSVTTAVAGPTGVTFTGLAEDTRYIAFAFIGGAWRRVAFSTEAIIPEPVFGNLDEVITGDWLFDPPPRATAPTLDDQLVNARAVNLPAEAVAGGGVSALAELQENIDAAALIGGGIIDGHGRTYGIDLNPGLVTKDNVELWNMTLLLFGAYPFADTDARILKNANDGGNTGVVLRNVTIDGGGMKSWESTGSITSGENTLTVADATTAEVGMPITVEGAGPLVATTTGSLEQGRHDLTVASAAGISVGDDVLVTGAGPGGVNLLSRVDEIHGSVLTLRKKCGTTVTGVAVTARGDLFTIQGKSGNVLTLDGNASATVSGVAAYMDQSEALNATAIVLKGCKGAYVDVFIKDFPGGGYHPQDCQETRTIITTRRCQRGPFIPKGDCSGLIAWVDLVQPDGGDDCINISATGSIAGADAKYTDGFTIFGRAWQGAHRPSGGNEGAKFTGCRNGTAWLDTQGGDTGSIVVQDGGDVDDIYSQNVTIHATSRDSEGNAFLVSSAGCTGITLEGDAVRPGQCGALIEVIGDGTIEVNTDLYVEEAGAIDTTRGALRFRDNGTTGTINGHHKLRVADSAGGFVQMKGAPAGRLTFDIAGTDPNSEGNSSEDAVQIDGPDARITNLWIRRTGANKARNALRLVSGSLTMPQGALDAAPGDFSGNLTSGAFTPSVASAATVAVPSSARAVTITGTADITSITATYDGHIVTLVFTGTAATNGVVDGSNLKLAGSLVYTPDDTLTVVCDGSNWREISRAVN